MESSTRPEDTPKAVREPPSEAVLIARLSVVQEEDIRLRNREWANEVLFTGAIAAAIVFVLNDGGPPRHQNFFCAAFLALAVGNVFYTCFAHERLTAQRKSKYEIMCLLDAGESLAYEPSTWWVGFWSHLLPFFVTSLAIAAFGIHQLKMDWSGFGAISVALAAAIIVYFAGKTEARREDTSLSFRWRITLYLSWFFAIAFVAATYGVHQLGMSYLADVSLGWFLSCVISAVFTVAVAFILFLGCSCDSHAATLD